MMMMIMMIIHSFIHVFFLLNSVKTQRVQYLKVCEYER